MIGDDLIFGSVRSLADAVRTRKVSPVELTEAYLQRLETIGPRLNAVVTVTRDLALAQAKAAEKEIAAGKYRGPLHGIPYGIKDAFATKGIPTTWGTAPYRDRVFDYDAAVVKRLAGAGAVPDWQARHDRAGRRVWIYHRRFVVHRSVPYAMEPRLLQRRIVERSGGCYRRRSGRFLGRRRNGRVDRAAFEPLRRVRHAHNLRSSQPGWFRLAMLDPR